MAESVPVVPHDFGVKYFDSKHHSNIVIILKDGRKINVNSIILSINSPFLEEMIEKRNLNTIEMDEFDAVLCKRFLKSLYTGDLGVVDRRNFRQVSKLSYRYQVEWAKQKCLDYFNSLINTSTKENDAFLLEEAIAAKAFDKEGQYLDALAQKKTGSVCNQDILRAETMVKHLDTLHQDHLDFIIRLANKCNRIMTDQLWDCPAHGWENIQKEYSTVIVEGVTAHLGKLEKMDVKTRYVLQKLDFSGIVAKFPYREYEGYHDSFKAASSKLFQSLLNLKEISNDDMKITLKHYMSLGNY